MPKTKHKDIDWIFQDERIIETAVAQGAEAALRKHVQAGVPAAEWSGDRLVMVSPRRLAARLRANGGSKAN